MARALVLVAVVMLTACSSEQTTASGDAGASVTTLSPSPAHGLHARKLGRRPDSFYEAQKKIHEGNNQVPQLPATPHPPLGSGGALSSTGLPPAAPAKAIASALLAQKRLSAFQEQFEGGRLVTETHAQPCCYKVPIGAKTASWRIGKTNAPGPMFGYYTFLVDFAAPMVSLLQQEPPGKKTLILPDWHANEMFHITADKDPGRTMRHHFDFLFDPLQLDLAYWGDSSTYEKLPCKEIAWDPASAWTGPATRNAALRSFRSYAQQLAQVESTTPTHLILIKRGSQGDGTCTGSCRRHLDGNFFLDAKAFLEDKGVPFVVVETDNMSLEDQIRLFSSATGIVGAHGAGLTNLLFSQAQSLIIDLANVVEGNRQPDPKLNQLSAAMGMKWEYCRETAFSGCLKEALLRHLGDLIKKQKNPTVKAAVDGGKSGTGRAGNKLKSAPFLNEKCSAAVSAVMDMNSMVPSHSSSCFKVPPTARTSWDGGLHEYYHFLIDFAAPIVYLLKDKSAGKKTLIMPEWDLVPAHGFGWDRFHLTYSRDLARSMQAHADYLFGPIGLEVRYEQNQSTYEHMDCEELDWNPGDNARSMSNDKAAVYQHFRDYARKLALGSDGDAHNDSVIDVVILKRGMQNQGVPGGSCTGSCRRHLDPGFFVNATAFFEARGISYELAITDNMDMRTQIRLFARARVLMGLHGAGLSNMIFMKPGGYVIELGLRKFDCFETLALFKLGLNYAPCNHFPLAFTPWDPCEVDRIGEAVGLVPRSLGNGWRPFRFPN